MRSQETCTRGSDKSKDTHNPGGRHWDPEIQRGEAIYPKSHSGKWQSQADPTATEGSPDRTPCWCDEDFLSGEMGVAAGVVKEMHPHPNWFSQGVPSLEFPGGPSKVVWGGVHAIYSLLKSLMDTAPLLRAGPPRPTYAPLLWAGFYQPTVPIQTLWAGGS